jgi:putative acetyltransferase
MIDPAAGDRICIERAAGPTAEVSDLIAHLDATLAQEYLPEQRHGLALEDLFAPHLRFFIARLDGWAAGCAGVALFDSFAELKRMYVRDAARGRGLAQALLAHIESEARANGRTLLRLETGSRQAAALRVYQRAGFVPCAAFGDYAALPPEAIATSVFLEKRIPPHSLSS